MSGKFIEVFAVRCSPVVFSKVLAARKTNLITARARKKGRSARVLANARKDHSIPLIKLLLPGGGGGGLLGSIFAGYVPLASQSTYPIIVYFVANCKPHLSHF